jgi:hypothetical protein
MVLCLKTLTYQIIASSCDFDVVLKQGRISTLVVTTSLNYFGNLKWRIHLEIMIRNHTCEGTGQRVRIPSK